MKKLTLTAVSTAILSLSIAATVATPSFAQQKPTTTTSPAGKVAPAPAGTNAQPPSIDELKLTKEQQTKLVKLQETVMQKRISVLLNTCMICHCAIAKIQSRGNSLIAPTLNSYINSATPEFLY